VHVAGLSNPVYGDNGSFSDPPAVAIIATHNQIAHSAGQQTGLAALPSSDRTLTLASQGSASLQPAVPAPAPESEALLLPPGPPATAPPPAPAPESEVLLVPAGLPATTPTPAPAPEASIELLPPSLGPIPAPPEPLVIAADAGQG
jgi:hypothetical protein